MRLPERPDLDNTLEHMVRQALWWDERLADCAIRSRVRERCAFLGGVVPHLLLRIAAEEVVAAVPGIVSIVNDIVVVVPVADRLNDEMIRRAALAGVGADDGLLDQRIATHIHDGWLWLDGIVDDHAKRIAAQRVAERVRGIRGMTSLLRLKPRPVSPNGVQQIECALTSCLGSEAAGLRVDIVGHTALLEGTADSIRIRRGAEDCAWVPGISTVANRVEIRRVRAPSGM